MSRSSPGRYAMHEFAKNVFDVAVTDGAGAAAAVHAAQPAPVGRAAAGRHRARVATASSATASTAPTWPSTRTHAHINMPAAMMWARGLGRAAGEVRFEPPPGASWRVATQLFPGPDAFTFTAPNLQYLMDSPTEFGAFDLRTFTVPDGTRKPEFRVAVHHQGDGAELDGFVARRGEDRSRGPQRLRRVRAVRRQHLHVPGRLRAVGQRRRHGAPQQHGAHLRPRPSAATGPTCSTPSRTSSSTRGTSSASGPPRSSRSTSRTRTSRASCGSPRGSPATTRR